MLAELFRENNGGSSAQFIRTTLWTRVNRTGEASARIEDAFWNALKEIADIVALDA
jgi:predicted DNA-binding ribbon-helix-helix protein